MGYTCKRVLLVLLWALPVFGQVSAFQHIIVVVQENRTPDNLFQGLCIKNNSCTSLKGPGGGASQYNIQTNNWLDKTAPGGVRQPQPVPLGDTYDLSHAHSAWVAQCDRNAATGQCAMDGAAGVKCVGTCLTTPQFRYVDYSTGSVNPYLTIAFEYGWANFMYQTNQGPSYPAHQYLFGATSARSASEDHAGTFVAENPTAPAGGGYSAGTDTGCLSPLGEFNFLIDSTGKETKLINNPLGTFCYSRDTAATLLDDRGKTWKYYTIKTSNPNGANPGGSIWTAPNSIQAICVPDLGFQNCTGTEWVNNVDLHPSDVLGDISGTGTHGCNLKNVSWVIPTGQNSDHPGSALATGGPSWVASIVNAVGTSPCRNPDGTTYWNTTAIVITWDDWGGWYDHVAPIILPAPEGGYQAGFRVPLLFVSAYTPVGYIDNFPDDFGSIIRFIEHNFGIAEGSLTFADARSFTDLSQFYNLSQPPRIFTHIQSPLSAQDFINDKTPPEPPDND